MKCGQENNLASYGAALQLVLLTVSNDWTATERHLRRVREEMRGRHCTSLQGESKTRVSPATE